VRSDDPRLERALLDEQTVIVPALEAWPALLEDGELDGRAIGVGRLAEQYVALANATPGLLVGLGDDPTPNKPWWIFHVVRHEGSFARVHVERQRCEACAWSGPTGNPRMMALYLGTPDPLAALARGSEAAPARCPACGAPLSRPARWVSGA
jgi:hypothetical protein